MLRTPTRTRPAALITHNRRAMLSLLSCAALSARAPLLLLVVVFLLTQSSHAFLSVSDPTICLRSSHPVPATRTFTTMFWLRMSDTSFTSAEFSLITFRQSLAVSIVDTALRTEQHGAPRLAFCGCAWPHTLCVSPQTYPCLDIRLRFGSEKHLVGFVELHERSRSPHTQVISTPASVLVVDLPIQLGSSWMFYAIQVDK